MAYVTSGANVGNGTALTVTIPSNETNDWMILLASNDLVTTDYSAGWPAGFSQLLNLGFTATDGQGAGIAWKRISTPESGTYTVTPSGSINDWVLQAYVFRGRSLTINPQISVNLIQTTAQSSPFNVCPYGLFAEEGDDLLWVSFPDVTATGVTVTHTAPDGMTIGQDSTTNWSNVCGCYENNIPKGATGSPLGVVTLSTATAGWASFLLSLRAEPTDYGRQLFLS